MFRTIREHRAWSIHTHTYWYTTLKEQETVLIYSYNSFTIHATTCVWEGKSTLGIEFSVVGCKIISSWMKTKLVNYLIWLTIDYRELIVIEIERLFILDMINIWNVYFFHTLKGDSINALIRASPMICARKSKQHTTTRSSSLSEKQ